MHSLDLSIHVLLELFFESKRTEIKSYKYEDLHSSLKIMKFQQHLIPTQWEERLEVISLVEIDSSVFHLSGMGSPHLHFFVSIHSTDQSLEIVSTKSTFEIYRKIFRSEQLIHMRSGVLAQAD